MFPLKPIFWALTLKKYSPIPVMPKVCFQNFRLVPRDKTHFCYYLPLKELSIFSMQSLYPPIQIPADHSPCGLSRSPCGPQEIRFLSLQVSNPLLPGPFCYIHGKPYDDFCQIKSIMLIHWFVHHKLNTIGLKIWAPGRGKPSQFPKRDPSPTQSHKHIGVRTLTYTNRCIINTDKEA